MNLNSYLLAKKGKKHRIIVSKRPHRMTKILLNGKLLCETSNDEATHIIVGALNKTLNATVANQS